MIILTGDDILTVPILDLSRSFGEIKPEVLAAMERIFDAQSFILGHEVKTFEAHCDSYLGVPEGSCVGCASGTDALLLAMMSCDIKPGDEIITTPFTFFATSGTAARLGAVPVFADVDPVTYNIDIQQAMTKITPRTKAFLPVHLFGQMTPVEGIISELHERGIMMIEDTAQAFGATRFADGGILRAGTVGDVGCFSFFPTKNLGGCGDGGMVVTRDKERADRLRRLRVHGSGTTYYHDEVGINSRLDAIQAAILDIKLSRLEAWNEERRKIADYYKLLFKTYDVQEFITAPVELAGNYHIYHQYVVRVREKRDALMEYLNAEGFGVRVYYPLPLHLQPCFAYLGYKAGDFPVSERLSREVLALPVFPGLKAEEQESLVSAMRKFFRK